MIYILSLVFFGHPVSSGVEIKEFLHFIFFWASEHVSAKGKADNKFWNIKTKWLSDFARESNKDNFTGYSYIKLHKIQKSLGEKKFLQSTYVFRVDEIKKKAIYTDRCPLHISQWSRTLKQLPHIVAGIKWIICKG